MTYFLLTKLILIAYLLSNAILTVILIVQLIQKGQDHENWTFIYRYQLNGFSVNRL